MYHKKMGQEEGKLTTLSVSSGLLKLADGYLYWFYFYLNNNIHNVVNTPEDEYFPPDNPTESY